MLQQQHFKQVLGLEPRSSGLCRCACVRMRTCAWAPQRKYGGQGTMPMLFPSVCCLSLGDQTQVVKLDSRCLCPRSHLTGLKLSFRAYGQRERWDQPQPAHCFYRLPANKEPTREEHSIRLTLANTSWCQLQGLGCLFLYLHVD